MQANCSICLEDIGSTNSLITECGHTFHSTCLMQNVAYNGFGCPYCRTEMATVPEDEDEEDEEGETEETEDYVLRGLRLFDSRINDEPPVWEDISDELYETGESLDGKPTTTYISEKMIEEGVTVEDFIKAMLKDVNEYEDEEEEFMRIDDELFGKMRRIIINYQTS